MYEFKQTTTLNYPIQSVFDFFSNAENLERITPPIVGFKITTPTPIEIREGTIIDYRLKIHGLPIRWRTLINAWEPPHRFVDEQIKGPYRQWIHEHSFESIKDGAATQMTDHVQYSIFAGKLVHFIIKKDIASIFDHRTKVIKTIFPESNHIHSSITQKQKHHEQLSNHHR